MAENTPKSVSKAILESLEHAHVSIRERAEKYKSNENVDPKTKMVFQRFINEVKGHIRQVDKIIDFYQKLDSDGQAGKYGDDFQMYCEEEFDIGEVISGLNATKGSMEDLTYYFDIAMMDD